MKRSTKILLILTVVLTAIVAWGMTAPDHYRDGPGAVSFTPPYAWAYPIWMAVYGATVTVLLSLRSSRARFVGAISSVVLGIGLSCLLVMTIMHSHSAHTLLLMIVSCSVLLLIFYSGYTFANWRMNSADGKD